MKSPFESSIIPITPSEDLAKVISAACEAEHVAMNIAKMKGLNFINNSLFFYAAL
jgi:hypothetical protein